MPLPEKLLEILVCPQSKGPLEQKKDDDELFCETSKLRYPVRNNVPILFDYPATQKLSGLPIKNR